VFQQKVSRTQLERRLANVPRCLIGMKARMPWVEATSKRMHPNLGHGNRSRVNELDLRRVLGLPW
jgi:hypothetical protein